MKKNKSKLVFHIIIIFFTLININGYSQSKNLISGDYISFDKYLAIVGENNLQLLSEKYNVKIADAQTTAAKVMNDPELGFEGSHETYKVKLGYTFELGNKTKARVNLAKSESEVTKLSLEIFFQELRAEATNAFLDCIFQNKLLQMKKSSYDYMQKLINQSDSIQLKKGELSDNDAIQSKLEKSTLLNDFYTQEAEYKSSLATLKQYMGQTTDKVIIPKGNLDNFDRLYNLDDLLKIASNKRLDLMMLEKNNKVALNQLKLAKAERKTDLGISIGYERDWEGIAPSANSIIAELSIPLKISNLNKGNINAANFAIEQNQIETQNKNLNMQTEVSQALYHYQSLKNQVEQYKSGLLEVSQKVLKETIYKYKQGKTDISDVLTAQRTSNDIEEQYLNKIKEYASALIDLQKKCGIWDINF